MPDFFKKAIRNFMYFPEYFSWLYRYFKLELGANTLKDIKILSIEFSSVCNLRCKYCFLEQNDRPRFLDIKLYEKLIKEVAESPKYNIRTMEWPISGAFFVYPNYREVIEITKKYWDANSHFRPTIILNDNLMLLDDEKIDLILKSGIVRQVICSIDGVDAKSYEDMRPPAKFNKMKVNFHKLVQRNKELGRPVFIQINNGRDQNPEFSSEMIDIFKQGDDRTFWTPRFWNESFNEKEMKFYPARGFCTFVFNSATLSSGGQILKCCMDLKGSTAYGDFSKKTLEEIWHSEARKHFLKLMFRHKRRMIQGCHTCSITNTNNDNRFNSEVRKLKRLIFPSNF